MRRRLLDKALVLFADRGFDGVAVDEIVEAAGVNKRMVYHYFGSKEGIYATVLEQAYEGLRGAEEKLFDPVRRGVSPRKAMTDLVAIYFKYLQSNPAFVRLLLWENLQRGRHLAQAGPLASKSPMLAHLKTLLDEGVQAKVFRKGLDPRQVLVSLIGLCLVYFSNRHTLSLTVGLNLASPKVLASAVRHTSKLLLEGISQH